MKDTKCTNMTNKKNAIADCFKILSIFITLLEITFFIFCFIIMYKENAINFSFVPITVIFILSTIVTFFVLRAIAEIIQLLEDIKNK